MIGIEHSSKHPEGRSTKNDSSTLQGSIEKLSRVTQLLLPTIKTLTFHSDMGFNSLIKPEVNP